MLENEELNLVTAEEMREITKTQEVIFQERKTAFLQNLSSNCANSANQGKFNLNVPITLNGFGDETTTNKMLNEVRETFQKLGYLVSIVKNESTEKMHEHFALTIDWSLSE